MPGSCHTRDALATLTDPGGGERPCASRDERGQAWALAPAHLLILLGADPRSWGHSRTFLLEHPRRVWPALSSLSDSPRVRAESQLQAPPTWAFQACWQAALACVSAEAGGPLGSDLYPLPFGRASCQGDDRIEFRVKRTNLVCLI